MSARTAAASACATATLRDVDLELVRARNATEALAAVAWLEERFDARWEQAEQRARVAELAPYAIGWLASADPELRVATVCVRPMLEVDDDPGACQYGCPCTWDTRPQPDAQADEQAAVALSALAGHGVGAVAMSERVARRFLGLGDVLPIRSVSGS